MPVFHRLVHMSNLPVNIPAEKLLIAVKKVLKEDNPEENFEDLQIRVLPVTDSGDGKGRGQQWAILHHITLSPKSMSLLKLRPLFLKHGGQTRNAIWHTDTLQNYGDDWQPEVTMGPPQIRRLQGALFGESHKKTTVIFKPDFMDKINRKVWDPNSGCVRLDVSSSEWENASHVTWDYRFMLGSSAFILHQHLWPDGRHGKAPIAIKATYGSPLDTVQSIRKLNGNVDILGSDFRFMPLCGRANKRRNDLPSHHSSCTEYAYLGSNGNELVTKDALKTDGYAALDQFDQTILQAKMLNPAMINPKNNGPVCITCQKPYQLLGTSVDFCWLPAKCTGCEYEQPFPHDAHSLLEHQPVRWRNENFTRLVIASDVHGHFIEPSEVPRLLVVNHEPLLLKYESQLEYSAINSKLVKAEYEYTKSLMAAENVECPPGSTWHQTDTVLGPYYERFPASEFGKQADLEALEAILERRIQQEEGRMANPAKANDVRQIVLKTILVPLAHFPNGRFSKLWSPTERNIRRVLMSGPSLKSSRAQVLEMRLLETQRTLQITVRYRWKGRFDPNDAPSVSSLQPLSNSTDFLRSVELLTKFVDTDSVLSNTFLGTTPAGEYVQNQSLLLEPTVAIMSLEKRNYIKSVMRQQLEESQLAALDLCMSRSMALVQGPPGTGKTTTLCSLAFTILTTNPGKILILCGSNTAADNVARSIENFKTKHSCIGQISSVRLYCNSIATKMLAEGGGTPFPTVHDEIRKTVTWRTFKSRFGNVDAESWKLQTREEIIVDLHERVIEQRVLQHSSIIIATFATALDGRLDSFIGDFSSVLVDESGQTLEYLLLTTFLFKANRCVFFGDQNQLAPTVTSPSALASGFCMSILTRSALVNRLQRISNDVDIFPFVMLREQHRMHHSIASIISDVFYGRKLVSAASVMTRELPSYFGNLIRLLPEFRRGDAIFVPVVSTRTEGEKTLGVSKYNTAEMNDILRFVRWLLTNDVPAAGIRILTNYDAQRIKLMEKISLEFPTDSHNIQIQTVDSAQGDQCDLCIYSTVRQFKPNSSYEFLMERQRLCVALSRCKYALFIFGDVNIFKNVDSKVLKSLNRHIIDKDQILDVNEIVERK